jgi:hypothetical protein
MCLSEVSDKKQYGRYSIEYKGRNLSNSTELLCAYGKAQRVYRIADLSNGDFEEVSCCVRSGFTSSFISHLRRSFHALR